jgi:hypothetical protein
MLRSSWLYRLSRLVLVLGLIGISPAGPLSLLHPADDAICFAAPGGSANASIGQPDDAAKPSQTHCAVCHSLYLLKWQRGHIPATLVSVSASATVWPTLVGDPERSSPSIHSTRGPPAAV